MRWTAQVVCSAMVVAVGCGWAAADVTNIGMGFVTVGDAGNPAYQGNGDFHQFRTIGRGSVDYDFQITRSEIGTAEWLSFYNTFGTISDDVDRLLRPTGWGARSDIFYNGPGDRYELSPARAFPERTPIGVRLVQAQMYANWLHHGMSTNLDDLFTGAYEITFSAITGNALPAPSHSESARYRLPTLDEYMKAVYFDPNGHSGEPTWYQYPHGSDDPPTVGLPGEGESPFGVDEDILLDRYGASVASVVPLGEYPDVQSAYGLIDTIGGSSEFISVYEVTRVFGPDTLDYWSFRNGFSSLPPLAEQGGAVGLGSFRIVTVIPAPSTTCPVAGLIAVGTWRRRR